MRTDAEFLLNRELEDHQPLLRQLADIADGDEAYLADLIEGETSILELIEKLDQEIAENEIVLDGAKKQEEKMADRRKSAERRIDRMKSAIKHAMELAQLNRHATTISNFTISPSPIKAIVHPDKEADVPSKWWKTADPKLDQAGLTAYFRDAKKAADAAKKIKDEAAREAALKQVDIDFPPIPGVTVSEAATQISRRS